MDERQDLALPVGEVRDRRSQHVGPLADEDRMLGLEIGGWRLDRLADLGRNLLAGPDVRVERPDIGPLGLGEAVAQLEDGDLQLVRELVLRRRAADLDVQAVAGLADVPLVATDGPGSPVEPAKLVHDRSADPGPGVLLERRALDRVEAVDGRDQRHQPARHEVVELAVGRNGPRLARGQVLDHRSVGEHEAVAGSRVAALAPGPPEALGLDRAQALVACSRSEHDRDLRRKSNGNR